VRLPANDVPHPSIHLEVARQRHQDLLAGAECRWIADASDGNRAWPPSGRKDAVEVRSVQTPANHFGHRETDDIAVDLFWSRRVGDEFRVEVEDRRERVRFVLYPTTGKAAVHAFYHPFAVARGALYDEAEAA
jgi:hypothetical protein